MALDIRFTGKRDENRIVLTHIVKCRKAKGHTLRYIRAPF